MKDSLPRYTLRVPQELLDKLAYIADYEGRTKNKELEQLIKRHIEEFEESLKTNDKVLYLVDNTGEIVFDKLLLSKIKEYNLDITIAVKSEPILNDACMKEALEAGADIIMLDNMDNATMTEAVAIIKGANPSIKTEASGNMNIPRLKEVAATGVDYISVGALTHTVKAMDISMNIMVD